MNILFIIIISIILLYLLCNNTKENFTTCKYIGTTGICTSLLCGKDPECSYQLIDENSSLCKCVPTINKPTNTPGNINNPTNTQENINN